MMKNRLNQYFPRVIAFGVSACLILVIGISLVSADRSDPPVSVAPTAPVEDSGLSLPPCCPIDEVEPSEVDLSKITPSIIDRDTKGVELPPATTQPAEHDTVVGVARAGQWIEPDDREAFDLDYDMTDQDGESINLSDLAGVPLAVSFIFTRCPSPQMCPLITLTMANLQRDLEDAGLSEKVRLALITYDPVYDTPARLKAYGADRGLRFNNAVMLRPGVEQFRQLLNEFQVGVDYGEDGSIGHFIELLLIDHKGRFVRDYQGQVWDNGAVLDDLKKLVAQQEN